MTDHAHRRGLGQANRGPCPGTRRGTEANITFYYPATFQPGPILIFKVEVQ